MSDNSASCFLMGGLGNQLFQIFATLAYCIRYRKKMILPYSTILSTGISRPTYWDTFLSNFKRYTTFNANNNYTNEDLYQFPMLKEQSHNYKEIPFVPTNFLLNGYFQSFKYFRDVETEIFSIMNLQQQKTNVRNEFAYLFSENTTTISMHFRLGDYKQKQDYHPIIPYRYYELSLLHIIMNTDLLKPITVIYFCEEEDNKIVGAIINKLKNELTAITFVKANDQIEDWKQLLIMSSCHHNIIANSSFSWWGAYFNQNKDKVVCYPKMWFGPAAKNDVSDMFPSDWNKIEW